MNIKILIVAFFLLRPFFSISQESEKNFSIQLNSFLDSFFKKDAPGGTVLIARPGSKPFFAKGYGLADLKTKTPITTKTLFNLGSISKTFVAYGILKLQEAGKLSIEDPIVKYFPDFKNKELVKNIKIKHLLSHCSGLPDNRPVDRDSIFFLSAKDEENFAPIKLNEKLNFEPGEKFQYSNPAFNGLALIIEKVSGIKWQQYIAEYIFKPSGMKTSVITDGAFPDKGVAHGYRTVNGKYEEYDYGEYPTFAAAGNGGVWSSAEELLKYEDAIQKNLFLNKDLITLSRTVFKPDNWKSTTPPFLGFSWFVQSDNGKIMHHHTGEQGGFLAHHFYFPEKKLLGVIIVNGSQDVSVITEKIIALLERM